MIWFTCMLPQALYTRISSKKSILRTFPPSIPLSSMPALGVSSPSSSGSCINQPHPGGLLLSPVKPPRLTPIHRHLKMPKPSTDIDNQLLKDFCRPKPFSLEASKLVHDVVQGESGWPLQDSEKEADCADVQGVPTLLAPVTTWVTSSGLCMNLCQNLSIKERRAHQPPNSMWIPSQWHHSIGYLCCRLEGNLWNAIPWM